MSKKKFIVWVLWGDTDKELLSYKFDTQEQLDYFLTGISEAQVKIGCADYDYRIQDKKPKLKDFDGGEE